MTLYDKSNNYILKTIGETIRELRESSGLLLREVAAKTEMDTALLSKVERGERLPTREQVLKLSHLFKADEKKLLVLYLSDKLMESIGAEDLAIEAMKQTIKKLKHTV